MVDIALAGGKMPKIIFVEPVKVYANVRQNLAAMKMAFFALELVLKLTADEQKNELLFNLLEEFLEFLNSETKAEILNLGLAKFKAGILEASGLGVQYPANFKLGQNIYFSAAKGGFTQITQADALQVSRLSLDTFLQLSRENFNSLAGLSPNADIAQLQNLLSKFIEYQLERKIKSETYLNMV